MIWIPGAAEPSQPRHNRADVIPIQTRGGGGRRPFQRLNKVGRHQRDDREKKEETLRPREDTMASLTADRRTVYQGLIKRTAEDAKVDTRGQRRRRRRQRWNTKFK